MKTFWLSFVDPEKPEGQRFLGVCIVDIDDHDVEHARQVLRQRFPHALPGAEWVFAAQQKAWQLGCNPGGEVGSTELAQDQCAKHPSLVKNRLLQEPELRALDLID